MRWKPIYTEREIRDAVASATNVAGALRQLGLRPVGHNYRTLKRYVAHYGVSTSHFRPNRVPPPRSEQPLEQILVEQSRYSNRGHLKRRLYASGLKERRCELCGQGELWHGRRMALILDHINGVGNDNRIENLQIVCANCAATLDTHCGRRSRIERLPRQCLHCGTEFTPNYATHRYCSQACGTHSKGSREARPERRKVKRPAYGVLLEETSRLGFSATGRKYGVSDNAVRKWIRAYEAEAESRNLRGQPAA